MPISVPCAGCGKVLQVRDTAGGKRAQCSHCGDMIQIPKPAEPPPIEDFIEDFEEETAPVTKVTYEPLPRQGFTLAGDNRCPACGVTIEPGHSRCPYCRPDIDCSPKKSLRRRSHNWWSNPQEQDLTLEDIALCIVAAPLMLLVGLARWYRGHRTAASILIISGSGLVLYRAVIVAIRVWGLGQKFVPF